LLLVFTASRESGAAAPPQQHLVFGAGAHPDFSDVATKTPASIARQQEGIVLIVKLKQLGLCRVAISCRVLSIKTV